MIIRETAIRKTYFISKKNIHTFAILFLITGMCLNTFSLRAQDLTDIVRKNNKRDYREALSLQTDRDFYVSGEQVWFKIHKFNASTDKPDNVSRVVYIELLNRSGFPVNQMKIAISDPAASSTLLLSDTLSTGHYLLRAYTNWMKNFSQHDFAFKTIVVVHPDKIPSLPEEKNQMPETILFFPEGGKLLNGVRAGVLIKAINKTGYPVQTHGIIVDRQQDTVCRVHTSQDGVGIFFILPHRDQQYMLIAGNPPGRKRTFPIGHVDSTGFVLFRIPTVSRSALSLKVVRAPGGQGAKKCLLFIKKGGICSFLEDVIVTDSLTLRLVTDQLPPGVSDILLTSVRGDILASHRIFRPPDDTLQIRAITDKRKYGTREKVNVTISVTDCLHHPVASDLTVTVVKSGLLKHDRMDLDNRDLEKNYRLPGIPHSAMNIYTLFDFYPFPYTGSVSNITTSQPDIQYIPELEEKIMKGTITNYNTNQPLSQTKMFLSFIGKYAQNLIFSTDSSGVFFVNINQTGTRQIVIQPVDTETKNYYTVLAQDFLPGADHPLPGPYFPDTAQLDIFENMIISRQIEKIFRRYTRTDTIKKENRRSFSFYGEPVERIQLSNYIPLSTVREVIKEIVPYVSVYKRKGKSYLQMVSKYYGLTLNHPLVLVDGTPFNDIDQLLHLPASEIEAVEVVNLRYFFEHHLFMGIIHFITKKGNLQSLNPDPGIFRIEYPVLDQKCKAVFPRYDTGKVSHPLIPDFRNTLYWNPSLRTGKDGKATFDFFTSDEAGKYTLYIEGISSDGKKGTVTHNLIIE